ncbi:MAG: cytochrome c [Bacteroidia bacterium]
MESIKSLSVIVVFVIVTLVGCFSSREYVVSNFPEAMLPHVKEQYKIQWDKGKILYENNCSGCHTTSKGKKKYVPDFLEDQLRGYELRITNKRHEASLPDSLITEEELGLVMTFLRYKKNVYK